MLKVTYREKLFNSLVKNSNTVYIMMNASTKKIVYLTGNVEEVLGLKTNDKTDEQLVFEMLNISIIKSELNHWNEKDEYVSQMVLYDNPSYNHQMWIRLKIYPYKEKKETYYIIQVIDATKEHDRQHLLITQAGDIKLRENQLNQITSSIYDVEIIEKRKLDAEYPARLMTYESFLEVVEEITQDDVFDSEQKIVGEYADGYEYFMED